MVMMVMIMTMMIIRQQLKYLMGSSGIFHLRVNDSDDDDDDEDEEEDDDDDEDGDNNDDNQAIIESFNGLLLNFM